MVCTTTYTGKQAVTDILKFYYATVNFFFSLSPVLSWGKNNFRSYLKTNLSDVSFMTAY